MPVEVLALCWHSAGTLPALCEVFRLTLCKDAERALPGLLRNLALQRRILFSIMREPPCGVSTVAAVARHGGRREPEARPFARPSHWLRVPRIEPHPPPFSERSTRRLQLTLAHPPEGRNPTPRKRRRSRRRLSPVPGEQTTRLSGPPWWTSLAGGGMHLLAVLIEAIGRWRR